MAKILQVEAETPAEAQVGTGGDRWGLVGTGGDRWGQVGTGGDRWQALQ